MFRALIPINHVHDDPATCSSIRAAAQARFITRERCGIFAARAACGEARRSGAPGVSRKSSAGIWHPRCCLLATAWFHAEPRIRSVAGSALDLDPSRPRILRKR